MKFDNTKTYFKSLIKGTTIEKNDLENRIILYEHIVEILEKRENRKRVSKKEYGNLSQYGCPDFEAFKIICSKFDIDPEDYGCHKDNCVNKTCDDCYYNYIEMLAKLLNKEYVKII